MTIRLAPENASVESGPEGPPTGSDTFATRFEQAMRAARPTHCESGSTMEGKVLAEGRIQVGRRIGGGAMGTVYEAIDQNRPVAIKVLNRVHDIQVYRLKTEFRTLKELVHPNVISVYELFRENEDWFFTMERVNGKPLHRHLESRWLLHENADHAARDADLRSLLHQLIQGIITIHKAGLVHRDLKPSNVLVTDSGHVVILDFGLVSEQLPGGVGQTVDHRIAGTVGYMSAEQMAGAVATPASDWYALGAILHQLLTGKAPPIPTLEPFVRTPPACTGALAPLLASSVHHEMAQLCVRLLSPLAKDRPTDAELDALCADWEYSEPIAHRVALPVMAPPQFVGRERVLQQLRELQTKVCAGSLQVVLLYGPCGIGKTALLTHFAEEARNRGTLVLEGRCSEWESVPYKGLDSVVDQFSRLLLKMNPAEAAHLVPRHASAVMRIFPALQRVDTFREAAETSSTTHEQEWTLRRHAVSGLKDMFYRVSERYPLIVVVDDLQWADSNTLQLLGEIVAPPDTPNILVLLGTRAEHEPAAELMVSLSRAEQLAPIALESLDAVESHTLARQLLSKDLENDASRLVERIVHESRGIPEHIIAFAHELSLVDNGPEPSLLSHVLMARVRRLSESARELLELIAVAVRPITLQIAGECGIAHLQSSLHELVVQRLVRRVALGGTDCGFETYTDHVRQAVLHEMPKASVTHGHSVLARALESHPEVEPQWLLSHYRGAGSHAQAKEYSIIVAERALAVLAFDHAASMYLAALELTSEHSEDWVTLNVRCAEALTKAGRGAEAARAYMRAARSKPQRENLPLLNLAVEQWIRSGHLKEGLDLLRKTLEAVDIPWPESAVSAMFKLLCQRASIRMRGLTYVLRPEAEVPPALLARLDALRPAQTVLGTFDYLRGAVFAALALPLALKAGEPRRLTLALASEAVYSVMLSGENGEPRAQQVHGHIHRISRNGTGHYERAAPVIARALCSYWMGRWRDVWASALQAESILKEFVPGALWETSLLRSVRHTIMLHCARYHELALELPDQVDHACMRDDQYTYLDLLRRKVSLHLIADSATEAEHVLGELTLARTRYPFLALDHLIMSSFVATYLYLGHTSQARTELESRWKACRKMGMDRLPLVRLTVIAMQGDCVAADESLTIPERVRVLKELASNAEHEPLMWAPSLAHALLAAAYELLDDASRAWSEFNLAADGFDTAGLHSFGLAAKWRAGQLTEARQEPAEASGWRQIDDQVRAMGVGRPDRWVRVVHCLY